MLALREIACLRGGRMLFEGVSLTLGQGEAARVTGPNGSGKSSLLRIAAGLLAPAAGSVERVGAVALLGEASALDPELPLLAALRFWARIDGRDDAIDRALVALRLIDLAHVPVRLLSTGQRRRAGFARVMCSAAPIWLLDEPANGLDEDSILLLEALIGHHRASGGAVVVATHQRVGLAFAHEVVL